MIKSENFKIVLTKLLNTYLENEEIPTFWKTSKVYNIFKKENPNLPLNYRSITLLNTTYKIYSTILNNRLTNFMKINKLFSNMQGGFRQDRPTFAKIWVLRNIIEYAKINNQDLHVCYIDIQKAYDSVEYWVLDTVLQQYGFSQKFKNIISNICKNSKCNVILSYGLSKDIYISRGVK
jgi:Reverse transcriptase (RNA-dependent DNA polymerase)